MEQTIHERLVEEAKMRHIPSVQDLVILHEVEDREDEMSSFMFDFTRELKRLLDWKLKNGWGEKIKEAVSIQTKLLETKPNFIPNIHQLRHVWSQKNACV